MDAVEDHNAANSHYAQDGMETRFPAGEAPDDGYRMEAVDQNQPVVEEVGDF
jgi:hypothetical protein